MTLQNSITLESIAEIKHGYAFKGEYFQEIPTNYFLLTPGNFAIGGGFQLGKRKYYNGPVPADYVLKPGDLLVTMTDLSKAADTLGFSAIVPDDGQIYLHNQRLGKVTPKSSEISKNYLHWLMRSPAYRNEVLGSRTGSTVKHTSPSRILAFKFALPEKYERQRICDILDSLNDKIDLNRQMNETLEAIAQAIFKDWFVDFGPVKRKAAGETDPVKTLGGLFLDPDKASPIAAIFPDNFDDDGLPEGWERTSLERYSDLNPESWSKKKHPNSVQYLDLKNTKWGNIDEFIEYDWGEAPSRARRIVRPNDTMVGTVRPGNGSYSFISENGYTASTGFAVLRPKKAEYTNYVYIAATRSENIDRLAHKADGAAYPAVRPNIVHETPCLLFPKELMTVFEEIVFPMRDRIEHSKSENRTLTETRDYLLPKLMAGEVKVGEIERAQ